MKSELQSKLPQRMIKDFRPSNRTKHELLLDLVRSTRLDHFRERWRLDTALPSTWPVISSFNVELQVFSHLKTLYVPCLEDSHSVSCLRPCSLLRLDHHRKARDREASRRRQLSLRLKSFLRQNGISRGAKQLHAASTQPVKKLIFLLSYQWVGHITQSSKWEVFSGFVCCFVTYAIVMATDQQVPEKPLFRNIDADDESEQISMESLCMVCHENVRKDTMLWN